MTYQPGAGGDGPVSTLDEAYTPARMDEIRAALQPLVGARGAVTGMASTGVLGPSDVIELLDEIERLREVLVFADGFVVSQTSQWSDHTMVLADLYNDTTPLAGVIQRAGCHPRRRFRDA